MRQLIAAAFIATCALISAGHTQDYPTRPVTMVVPFAAGGPTDVLARVVADRMGQLLSQQVVVENIGGAGGMTGGSARRLHHRAGHRGDPCAKPNALQAPALQCGD